MCNFTSNLTVYTYIQREGTPDSGSEGRDLECTYDTSVEVFVTCTWDTSSRDSHGQGCMDPDSSENEHERTGEGSKKEIIILGSDDIQTKPHPPVKRMAPLCFVSWTYCFPILCTEVHCLIRGGNLCSLHISMYATLKKHMIPPTENEGQSSCTSDYI